MNGCSDVQARFNEYLDGRLTGVEMQQVSAHVDSCSGCAAEWASLRRAQAALTMLGPVPEPKDLLLRIRVAVSHERARRARKPLSGLESGLAQYRRPLPAAGCGRLCLRRACSSAPLLC